MATYKHIKKEGCEVQVGSAIRDGEGKTISTTYVKEANLPVKSISVDGTPVTPVAGNVDIAIPKEIFTCTYGTTTYSAVTQALAQGQLPICTYNNYQYVYCSSVDGYLFNSQRKNNLYILKLESNNTWSGPVLTQTQSTSDKTQSITSASTSVQYPSAKATYDAIEDIREVAEGKKATYVVSSTTNPAFNTQEHSITITTPIIDINGKTIALSDLRVGDTVYVQQTALPDRWVGALGGLPEAYQLVEYIENDGVAYLNLNYAQTSNSARNILDFAFVNYATGKTLFGNQNGMQFYNYIETPNFYAGGYTTFNNILNTTNNVRQVVDFSTNNGVIACSCESRTYNGTYTGTVAQPGTSQCLFTNAAATRTATIRVYAYKAYQDGALVRDMVPCYRKSDNAIGMFDLVNSVFYANANATGAFTKGPNISASSASLFILETAKVPITSIARNNTIIEPVNGLVNIDVPTQTSDLNNDTGFVTNQTAQITQPQVTNLPGDLQTIREQIAGLKNTYVISATDNPSFNTTADTIEIASFVDVNTRVHTHETTQIGDTVYVQQSNVLDRWVSNYVDRGARVPAAYQEVEYIESDAQQSIDTQYVPNTNTVFDFEITTTQTTPTMANFFYGVRNSGAGEYSAMTIEGGSAQTNFRMGSTTVVSIPARLNTSHIVGHIANGNSSVTYDGVTVTSATNYGTAFGSLSMTLFAIKNGALGVGRIHSFTISENGVAVHNYVPCYRKADNVAGLYDIVTSVFLTSSNGRNFTIGPDVTSGQINMILSRLETAKIPITSIAKNGTVIQPENGLVNIPVPTKTSDITNDSGFLTDATFPRALFWCTYNTTTYLEIAQAILDNKLPVCLYGDKLYVLVNVTATKYMFDSMVAKESYHISINNQNVWSNGSNILQEAALVSTIGPTSDNTHYPSAKCVYDNDQAIREQIAGLKNTYVVSAETNTGFKSDSSSITILADDGIVTTEGAHLNFADLKIGDTFYVAEHAYADRWISAFQDLAPITTRDGSTIVQGSPDPMNPAIFIDSTYFNAAHEVRYLRKINDAYTDSYDANTTTITRVIGVKELVASYFSTDTPSATLAGHTIFRNTSLWGTSYIGAQIGATFMCSHFASNYTQAYTFSNTLTQWGATDQGMLCIANSVLGVQDSDTMAVKYAALTAWLAAQKAAGTPVLIYYALRTADATVEPLFAEGARTAVSLNILESAKVPITSISKNGSPLTPVGGNVNISVPVEDSQLNGVSKVTQSTHIANITSDDITNAINLRGTWSNLYGLNRQYNQLYLSSATSSQIDGRTEDLTDNVNMGRQAITQLNIDYAVKKSLSDCKTAAYTAEQKNAATATIGAENAANKTATLDSSSTNVQYPGAKVVYDSLQDIREIAEGKKQTFVVSATTNPILNSEAESVAVEENLVDVQGETISPENVHVGDTFYVSESGIPDRWVATKSELPLPDDYQLVEYVDVPQVANVYFDTGVMANPTNLQWELSVTLNSITNQSFLGCRTTNNRIWNMIFQNAFEAGVGVDHVVPTGIVLPVANNTYVFNQTMGSDGWFTYINGTLAASGSESGSGYAIDGTLYLGATNAVSGSVYPANAKFRYCKIWSAGTLVAHLVPCYVKVGGEIGFYDLISESFISKGGTGDIVKGPDAVSYGYVLNKLETAKVPITSVSKNGTPITPVEGNVNITVPTDTAELTNGAGYITIGDVPQELYWCTYNTTTYTQIAQAVAANKVPVCIYNGIYFYYLGLVNNKYYLCHNSDRLAYRISVGSNNVWSYNHDAFEFQYLKTQTLSASSTAQEYPSAKATYDAIEDVREIAEGKKSTYVVSSVTNPIFASQNTSVEALTFTDINGTVFDYEDVHIGDTVYVQETANPDRWISNLRVQGSDVPFAYQEVEYIESNGTQYIDTGYLLQNTDVIEMVVTPTTTSGAQSLFGCNEASQTTELYLNGSRLLAMWGTNSYEFVDSPFQANTEATIVASKNAWTVNGTALGFTTGTKSYASSTLYVMARHMGSEYTPASGKLKHFIVKNSSNEIVVNLIPCYRKSDNVIGVYDTVAGAFLENAGSGTFTKGSDVPASLTYIVFTKLETAKVPITSISRNTIPLTPVNSNVDIDVPTKTSELTNDSDFVTTAYHDSTKQNVLIADSPVSIYERAFSGDNIFDEEFIAGTYDTSTGAFAPSNTRVCCKNYINVLPSTTYTFSTVPADTTVTGNLRVIGYTRDKTYAGYIGTSTTFTTPANCEYITFYIASTFTPSTYTATYNTMINVGSTALPYVPSGEIRKEYHITATVPTKVSQLQNDSGFVTSAYHDSTKQDVLTFDNTPTEGSNNPVKSDGVYSAIEEVREIAEGKKSTYVVSSVTNPVLNSQANVVDVDTNLVDVNGNIIIMSDTSLGDTFYITEQSVPDRWVSNFRNNGVVQVFQDGNFTGGIGTWSGIGSLSVLISNNEMQISTSSDSAVGMYKTMIGPITSGNKYMVVYNIKSSRGGVQVGYGHAGVYRIRQWTTTTEWASYYYIDTLTNTTDKYMRIYAELNAGDTIWLKNCMLIDLTEMYGAGNEPTSYAEFKNSFPESYYTYNTDPGSQIVELSKLETAKVPITSISKNGVVIQPVSNNVDITVPTTTSELTNTSGFITINDIPKEIYYCTYGTTTYAEISAALAANKLPVVYTDYSIGMRMFIFNETYNNSVHTFSAVFDGNLGFARCTVNTSNVWTKQSTGAVVGSAPENMIINRNNNEWGITTVNYDSAVKHALCDTDGTLNPAYTPAEKTAAQSKIGAEGASNKVTSIGAASTDIQYPSAKCVYDNIEEVREIAEGKTKTYVTNTTQVPSLNSQAAVVTLTSFKDKSGVTIPLTYFKVGDNIFVEETEVPDRWVSDKYIDSSEVTDLTNTTWEFNPTIDVAGLTANTSLAFNSNDDSYILMIPYQSTALYYYKSGSSTGAYTTTNGWANQAFRTIEITGGSDVTKPEALAFMKNNARLVSGGTLKIDLRKLETVKVPITSISKNGTTIEPINGNVNITVPTNADYVDLTSNQSIGGVKTFTANRLHIAGETHFNSGGYPTDYAYGYAVGIYGNKLMCNELYAPSIAYRDQAMYNAGKAKTTWTLPYKTSGSNYTLATTADIPSVPTVGNLITNATTPQATSAGQSMTGNITLHQVSKTGDADKVCGLKLNDQAMAYVNELTTTIGIGQGCLAGTMTEAEIFALTGQLYGKFYYASDTNQVYRRKTVATTAGAANFRNDTAQYNASLSLPYQLQDEPYIYIKVNTGYTYYSKLPKFFVTASYDNVAGSTTITGYCRAQGKFFINACGYNGNNLLGIYQPSANTDIYYLKLKRYASSYGAVNDYSVTLKVMTNFQQGTPGLEFIGKDHADYAKVSGYNYMAVPTDGISCNDIKTINGVAVGATPAFTDAKVALTPSSGDAEYPITFKSNNTASTETTGLRFDGDATFNYNPSKNTLKVGNITLPATGKINGVAIGSTPKFTDTTYTFAGGTNGFTVTPAGGTAQTVTITPSIANNITGSGTSGCIAKFNGANTLTSGPAFGTSTTTYLRNDGTWGTPAVEGANQTIKGNGTTFGAGAAVDIKPGDHVNIASVTTEGSESITIGVSVTKSDVGLGSVVNAGMDTNPTSGSGNYVSSGGVYTAINAIKYVEENAALTPISGIATWSVGAVTQLGTSAARVVQVYEITKDNGLIIRRKMVFPDIVIDGNAGDITVQFATTEVIAAGTYEVVVIG